MYVEGSIQSASFSSKLQIFVWAGEVSNSVILKEDNTAEHS